MHVTINELITTIYRTPCLSYPSYPDKIHARVRDMLLHRLYHFRL